MRRRMVELWAALIDLARDFVDLSVYGLAYTARCEHSLGRRTPGNALDALATHGEELFLL